MKTNYWKIYPNVGSSSFGNFDNALIILPTMIDYLRLTFDPASILSSVSVSRPQLKTKLCMNNAVAVILLSLLTHNVSSQNNSDSEINWHSITQSDIGVTVFGNPESISSHHRLSQFNNLKFSASQQNNEIKIDARNFNFLKSNRQLAQAHGAKMTRAGKILTFSGAAIYALTWGIILSDQAKFKGNGDESFPLLMLQGSGFYSMGAGITLWIIGGKKNKRYKESLKTGS